MHFDYDVWTDLLARPHAGVQVPTGLEIDAHRGRARIAANFELTVDTRHVLLKLPDFRIVVLELERHTTIDELTRHVRRRLRSTYRSLTNDDGATRAASRTATLAAISRLRLALPDSDGVMRYVAPSTTAEAADLFHRRDLVQFDGELELLYIYAPEGRFLKALASEKLLRSGSSAAAAASVRLTPGRRAASARS